jgi:hypothetical protein
MAAQLQEPTSEAPVPLREDISEADEAEVCAADVDEGNEDCAMDFDIRGVILLGFLS